MFQLIDIQYAAQDAYKQLTYNHLIPLIRRAGQRSDIIALGAEMLDQPIGLLLAGFNYENNSVEILSLFVHPQYRNIGVGIALMNELERRCLLKGYYTLKISYISGKNMMPALGQFLTQNGWEDPKITSIIHTTDRETVNKAPWIRQTQLPRDMNVLLWSELSADAREVLKDREKMGYPAYLSPYKKEGQIETRNSLVLRVGQQVVGWCITHQVAEDTITYDSLFVQQNYQHAGYAFNLLARSIQRQLDEGVPFGMFAVNVDNSSMVRIVDRWFKPYVIRTSEMRVSYKWLNK